jgi:hypothetical protein
VASPDNRLTTELYELRIMVLDQQQVMVTMPKQAQQAADAASSTAAALMVTIARLGLGALAEATSVSPAIAVPVLPSTKPVVAVALATQFKSPAQECASLVSHPYKGTCGKVRFCLVSLVQIPHSQSIQQARLCSQQLRV